MFKFVKRLKIVPSWFILFLDLGIVFISSLFALFIRDNFKMPVHFSVLDYFYIPFLFTGVLLITFLCFKTHKSVVRYTNTKDVIRIFWACITGSFILWIANIISFFVKDCFIIPTSILFMEFFISMVVIIVYRLYFKVIYLEHINPSKNKKSIIIYGAGETGINAKRALDRDTSSKYNVLAFFDDDDKKIGKNLENIPVLAYQELEYYLEKNETGFLIIAIPNLATARINEITDIAMTYKTKVLLVPPVTQWINGNLSFKQIKKVKIEDLLERDPIVLDEMLVNRDLKGQTILITGAAGSIGSEIVRQVLSYEYKELILVDNAETPMFFLYNESIANYRNDNIHLEIASVLDQEKMEELISQYQPSIIYHAAAYKHVPMMEMNCNAAVKVNVWGSKIMADLAVKYGVKKFVMISTDKAVNPTTIMGASKRVAEMYVQSLNFAQEKTKFITTRFGNVLGSNGSVIPIFNKQIREGGPITVTDPEVTRYFMTIPEACQLVINAGAMGNGGEIFIFDMGKPVKIYDLALKMIRLSGLVLDKDIQIKITGLRLGEKLYEELLADEENTIKTPHKKIMIAKVKTYEYEKINRMIERLIEEKNETAENIVAKLKELVPEFDSKNPAFQEYLKSANLFL